MRARSAILALLPLLVAGCAGQTTTSANKFSGDSAAVAKVVDNLSSAASNHDAAKICNTILAPDLAARLTKAGGSCNDVIARQLDTVDVFGVTVERVSISGRKATAKVKSTSNGKDRRDLLNLVRDSGGAWRIESLG